MIPVSLRREFSFALDLAEMSFSRHDSSELEAAQAMSQDISNM